MTGFLILTPIILFSLTTHEFSHALMAHLLGDDTAKKQGRLTFNPIKHLDPIGVVVFYFLHFGWAKPVPVDPRNLKNPHRDMLFIAAAGPACNLTLAILFVLVLKMTGPWYLEAMSQNQFYLLVFLCLGVYCNLALALFNMLPIFPLDGSSVLKGLMPRHVAIKLSQLDKFCGIGLLGIFLLDRFAETHILNTIFRLPLGFMVEFIAQDDYPLFQRVLGL